MVIPESKNKVGLGRALMNSRGIVAEKTRRGGKGGGKSKEYGRSGTVKPNVEIQKEYGSITEQAALDEFLATAELADTDFTAEKMNVKIIHKSQINPYLLSDEEEKKAREKYDQHAGDLTVPRRPRWNETTTPEELDKAEREAFLEWRRGLAELQENKDLLMTPFERNLEMWRQLWRVIERSDLVVQIVDARNPLTFRSVDLENYVKEVDSRKKNLLLINKADMMLPEQRLAWAEYFEKHGIAYKFFSAAMAKEQLEAEAEAEAVAAEDSEFESEEEEEEEDGGKELAEKARKLSVSSSKGKEVAEDPRTRILTVDELEEVFLEEAPQIDFDPEKPRKTVIGLVGYPNVGKSSTINTLIGAKKVSVSSTPGKTKHFQTIHLSPSVILCDCPGLVFPNFATTKAELVVNGILPIDQLREFTGPASLVAKRIPKQFLEAVYGFKIPVRAREEGGTGIPTAEEMLNAYARARGYGKTGLGLPDESRAARYILKDYVNGKLLFVHPPPEPGVSPDEFNVGLYTEEFLPQKRKGFSLAGPEPVHDDTDSVADDASSVAHVEPEGKKTKEVDSKFFSARGSAGGKLSTPFQRNGIPIQGGKPITGRKAKTLLALETGLTPEEVSRMVGSKKHFNKRK